MGFLPVTCSTARAGEAIGWPPTSNTTTALLLYHTECIIDLVYGTDERECGLGGGTQDWVRHDDDTATTSPWMMVDDG
jgi:hypothetical protein